MNSVEKLFPWLVISIAILIIATFGVIGLISGLIMIVSTVVYLYKQNRKSEFQVIFLILGAIMLIIIGLILFNTPVKTVHMPK